MQRISFFFLSVFFFCFVFDHLDVSFIFGVSIEFLCFVTREKQREKLETLFVAAAVVNVSLTLTRD